MLEVQKFEPVFIEFNGPALPTEYGKRWLDEKMSFISKFRTYISDILKVAELEFKEWDPRLRALNDAAIPLAASGFSQYAAPKVLNYCGAQSTTAFAPATVTLSLTPTTPTYTTTGVNGDNSGEYTGYVRYTVSTPATWWTAATTGAAPSVLANAAQFNWATCSGGSSITENGVQVLDNATLNTGNSYFWASITAVTISPTQTPPTVAAGALTVSLNTT
jgi:hypothetical protein